MPQAIISAEEVKRHNTRKSVWMVIRNEVYDVTPFIQEHPGGEDPLYESAGMDATIAFDDVGHSADAREMLKKYHIGTLAPGSGLTKAPCCSSPQSGTSAHSGRSEKSWRTFDGSPKRKSPPKSEYRAPCDPRIEPRVNAVVVPCERLGRECRPPPPDSQSNWWKWALLALAVAAVAGIAYKKSTSK